MTRPVRGWDRMLWAVADPRGRIVARFRVKRFAIGCYPEHGWQIVRIRERVEVVKGR